MKALPTVLLAITAQAFAQAESKVFPAEATPLASPALLEALSGKAYRVKLINGNEWRWQFDANGYFQFSAGPFKDTGKWSVKESSLCSEGNKISASCNEIRNVGPDLYYKRDNGDVVKMTLQ